MESLRLATHNARGNNGTRKLEQDPIP